MRQAEVWFWLSCRRYLRRISFAAILLLLPAGAYVLHLAEKSGDNRIPVAVCVADLGTGTAGSGRETGRGTGQAEAGTLSMQDADMEAGEGTGADLAVRLLKSLTDEQRGAGGGMFVFYACDSVEQVKDEVASRRAECGYAIASDLGERMAENDYKRSIRVYSAPTTVTAQLSQEVVFAELAALYDRELFLEWRLILPESRGAPPGRTWRPGPGNAMTPGPMMGVRFSLFMKWWRRQMGRWQMILRGCPFPSAAWPPSSST